MKLEITKNIHKPHVIFYIRDDGTNIWMHADDYFVLHDLSHYAIEKTLKYSYAFYGLINHGYTIDDFNDRNKRMQMNLGQEAWHAESMANLFLMEIQQESVEDFNTLQQEVLNTVNTDIPVIELSDNKIKEIRACFNQLIYQWKKLSPGEKLELEIHV